jgi:DNA processing protein
MSDEYIYLWAQWGILNGLNKHSFGKIQYDLILKRYGNLENAWKKIDVPFLQHLGFEREKSERVFKIRGMIDFEKMSKDLLRTQTRILCVDDKKGYPECLRNIPNPPVFLFIRGELPPLYKTIGVVGTRKITDYGKETTKKFVSGLVNSGFAIVSGLALGIDARAHRETLENGGSTIAVLGSGVDNLYPSSNSRLANDILKNGGAVVSEYPMGTPALAHHFPARNRIISGLSLGVLIIEGGESSGALITAKRALEQNREVFAVPGDINKLDLGGTNRIIRRSEAKLVQDVDHILEEFHMEKGGSRKKPAKLSDTESEVVECLRCGGKNIDELTAETTYDVSRLSEVLVGLQLKNVVREVDFRWVIA